MLQVCALVESGVEFAEYYSHSLEWLMRRLDEREAIAQQRDETEEGSTHG